MAIPGISAVISIGKGALAALRGSRALGAMKTGARLAAGSGKTAAKSVGRFAGDKGAAAGKRFASQFQGLTREQAVALFGPDIVMGAAAGAMTPGDLGDKALVGIASAGGGVIGGAAGRSIMKPGKPIGAMGYAADFIGSAGGDLVGYEGANAVVRARNNGLTPAEQEMLAYEEQVRQQAVEEFLRGGGGY